MRELTNTGRTLSDDSIDSRRGETSRYLRHFLTAGTALAALAVAGAGAPAFAAPITWDGGGSDFNWGTKNNWSGDALPTAADEVTIDSNGGLDTPVVLNVAGNVKTLVIDKGDSLSANNGISMTVHGGGASVANNGLWSMNATTSNTVLTFNGSSTLGGAGTLSLSDDAQNFINSNSAANVITQAAGHTIQGSGALLNNTGGMVNEGKILATGTSAALVIDPSAAGFVNKGALQAQGAAGLDFAAGNFTNTGQSIDVLSGSRLDLNNGSKVIGGALTTAGTGVINANSGSTLDGVTIDGATVQADGSGVTIVNGLTNNGLWSMNASAANTVLTFNGSSTLGGAGTLSLSDDTQNFIFSNLATNVITQAAGHTIQGSGQFLNNTGGMVNEGKILATGAVALVIDPSAAGFVNKGTLQAQGAAGLDFAAGNFTNTGNSIDVLSGSRLDLNNGSKVIGGTLTTAGTGVINANSGSTLDGVTIDGATVQANGQGVTILNGLTNNGLWSMNATTSNTVLTFNGSSTLGGAGTLSLSDDTQNFIFSNSGANVITQAAGHTIQGSGQFLNNTGGMVNEGNILATGSTAALLINPSAAGFVNKGTLQAQGAAGLGFAVGDFTNTGNSIDVLSGSRLDLNSGSKVIGGTLTTAGTGVINANSGSTLDGVTIDGATVQANGQGVTIVNGLTNNGLWSMNATTSNTVLTFNGSSTLGGAGVLSLSDDTQNFIFSNSGANVITQAAGHTIQGSGQFLNNTGGMVNEGKIIATGTSAALVIDPSAAGFDNKGTLRAQGAAGIDLTDGASSKNSSGSVEVGAGSRIDVTGNYRQTGGSTVVEALGLLTATGTVNVEGGRLGGNGTVDANVKNTGGVTGAGMSVGLLTIDGAYTQTSLGAFEVEIDSLTSFDFVDVLGAASLDGFLDVIIKQSIAYTLSVGSIFEVLNASSITGNFASLTDNIAGLTLERFVGAGSSGGQSVYLKVTENTVQPPVTDVPEPESALLFGAGLASIAALRRKLWRLLAG